MGQQTDEHQIKYSGVEERPDQAAVGAEGLTGPDEFHHADGVAKEVSLTRVMISLDMGGNHPLDHLKQGDAEKDLTAGHAQRLPGLPLAWGTPWIPPR